MPITVLSFWLIWHKCQIAYVIMNCPSCVVVVVVLSGGIGIMLSIIVMCAQHLSHHRSFIFYTSWSNIDWRIRYNGKTFRRKGILHKILENSGNFTHFFLWFLIELHMFKWVKFSVFRPTWWANILVLKYFNSLTISIFDHL